MQSSKIIKTCHSTPLNLFHICVDWSSQYRHLHYPFTMISCDTRMFTVVFEVWLRFSSHLYYCWTLHRMTRRSFVQININMILSNIEVDRSSQLSSLMMSKFCGFCSSFNHFSQHFSFIFPLHCVRWSNPSSSRFSIIFSIFFGPLFSFSF